jgi:hypothetical protein
MKINLKVLALIFFTLSYGSVSSQSNNLKVYDSPLCNRTVSFYELINELVSTTKNISISNVKVRWNEETDRAYMDSRFLSKTEPPILRVRHSIKLESCDFDSDYWLLLRNIQFDYLGLFHCSGVKINMTGCIWEDNLRINSNAIEFMKFEHCTFKGGMKFNRNSVSDVLSFNECDFSLPKVLPYRQALDSEFRLFLVDNRVDALNLTVQNCTFYAPPEMAEKPQNFIILANTIFNNLRFNNNKVDAVIDLSASTIENLFMTYNCDFKRQIIVNALSLNSFNTKVQWESVGGGKLAVLDAGNRVYSSAQADGLPDEFAINNLISCYANLYSAFRSQGNRLAANACYVEWKDLETTYLSHIYPKTESVIPYFTYLMNIFLKAFCDYGTNPFKSIVISMWVILSFGGLYYIFPGAGNLNQRNDFFHNFNTIARYYHAPLVWTRIRMKEMVESNIDSSYLKFVRFIKNENPQTPVLFRALAKTGLTRDPLRNSMDIFLLGLVRKSYASEMEIPFIKRVGRLIFYWTVISVFLVEIILLKVIEAVSMSLNVFSTLGYGALPESGLSRYLSIIEGFIGWFLLSIFSVALISQVIQ